MNLEERLTNAKKHDRDLDCEIYVLIGGKRPKKDRPLYWTSPDGSTKHYESMIPRFTSSYDAARTLIPSGLFWSVSEGKTRPDEPLGGAQIRTPNDALDIVAEAEHPSAIIALCIAGLRARAAMS